MRKSGDETRNHQNRVILSKDAQSIADDESCHQDNEQAPARDPAGNCCNQWRTNHHAERVGGDNVAGLPFGNTEVPRNHGQKTHGDKLRGANGESAHG